ncbi:MAG: hypothetical protein ACTSUK_02595 [Promethearchaeota archaeon]
MAKGNDGNLLQHTIETELAKLLSDNGNKKIQIVLTHGMAPYEEIKGRKFGKTFLATALKKSQEKPDENSNDYLPVVFKAYAKCHASKNHYPNSLELIAKIIGEDNVKCDIFEIESWKIGCLECYWKDNDNIVIHSCSWRQDIGNIDIVGKDVPCLISMDPYQYKNSCRKRDDGGLYKSDSCLIKCILKKLANKKVDGALSIFSYSMKKNEMENFFYAMSEIRNQNDENFKLAFLGFKNRNRYHVCALFATKSQNGSGTDYIKKITNTWVKNLPIKLMGNDACKTDNPFKLFKKNEKNWVARSCDVMD